MKTLEKLQKKSNSSILKANGDLKKRVIEGIRHALAYDMHSQYYTGSGRYHHLVSYTYEIANVLKSLGYKHSVENDAPRGGQEGVYFKISKTAKSALKELIS